MEKTPYVSCIKINGVPILPPLMTEDLRTEMGYYKQLAIAVEERLKTLEIAKQAKIDSPEEEEEIIQKGESLDSITEDYSITETEESSNVESAPNIETVIDFPTKENSQESHFSSLDSTGNTEETIQQSFCENEGVEDQIIEDILASSTCSDTVTASTDLNQYLDVSHPNENSKPQVPKTLDIVPITVDVPENVKSEDIQGRNTPPKLVRQGSYVLEAPSPMLLAHMRTELGNSEYIPTSTNAAVKRKEWNISQAKTEWENETRNKEFIIPADNSRSSSSQGRYRRNSTSGMNNQRIFKSLTSTKNSSSLGGHNRSARSVDCIQTMLDKELVSKSHGGKAKRQISRDNFIMKSNNTQKWKSSVNISILNLANRLGGSLGDLAYVGGQYNMKNVNDQSKSAIIEDQTSPSKSVAVSEKLLIIFKEIQRKHEEQMAELIAKQQNEQKNMQMEFEKQQVLLLGQIKKTFPGISIPRAPEIADNFAEEISPNCCSRNSVANGTAHSSDHGNQTIPKCPLDYIYPLNNGHCDLSSCKNNGSQCNAETSEDEASKGDEFHFEDEIKRTARSVDKYSNVSRQLFPLDCKTVHVPVPVNVLYTAEQIKAATVISAYARGYLVRRLMKTERVIALKNTYKEALHCMLKLHVDAPLNLPELNFHQRLQLQCDAASMNIAELFAQSAAERMQVISQDREIKRSKSGRPSSAHSYSFATQRTLARKKMKEMGQYSSSPPISRPCSARSRCQTWTSNSREKRAQNIYHGIKRSTSAGTVRKPWR